MPKPAQVAPSPWAAPSKGVLADRLGVGRNTPTVWQREGAPASLCEFQWRAWAAAAGRELPKAPAAELLQALVAAGIRGYAEGSAPTPAAEDPLEISRRLEGDPKAYGQYLANKERMLDLLKRSRELIALKDAEAAVNKVAKVYAAQLDRIGELVAAAAGTGAEGIRIRQHVVDGVDTMRTALEGALALALQELLRADG